MYERIRDRTRKKGNYPVYVKSPVKLVQKAPRKEKRQRGEESEKENALVGKDGGRETKGQGAKGRTCRSFKKKTLQEVSSCSGPERDVPWRSQSEIRGTPKTDTSLQEKGKDKRPKPRGRNGRFQRCVFKKRKNKQRRKERETS